jgi:hypothetical protein
VQLVRNVGQTAEAMESGGSAQNRRGLFTERQQRGAEQQIHRIVRAMLRCVE